MGTEGVLFALAIAVLWATLTLPGREAARDLGQLMLGLLVLWAYLDFMQFLIIWQSDLPHEAAWYVHRIAGPWAAIAWITAGLHFALPFFALLWPQVQRSPRTLTILAAILVASEIPRAWWVVVPSAGRGLELIDGVAMLAVMGLGTAIALGASRLRVVPGMVREHG